MADRSVTVFGVIALLGLMVGGCAGEGANTGTGINRIASGSVEDSLAACKGRIPGSASAGQQMLAEESCVRDQATRR